MVTVTILLNNRGVFRVYNMDKLGEQVKTIHYLQMQELTQMSLGMKTNHRGTHCKKGEMVRPKYKEPVKCGKAYETMMMTT